MAKNPKNIIGPTVRKLRDKHGWSQRELAEKCQLLGWDVGRDTIAKIEGQSRWIGDQELVLLAKALGVAVHRLFPESS
jgi:transcriptional regulator with XRE-family HTH domain